MAKQNGTIWKIVGILITVLIVAGGAVFGYGILSGQVRHNTETVKQVCARVDANTTAGHQRDMEIVGLKRDLEYLKEKAQEQKVDLDNHTVLLERILVEITKDGS